MKHTKKQHAKTSLKLGHHREKNHHNHHRSQHKNFDNSLKKSGRNEEQEKQTVPVHVSHYFREQQKSNGKYLHNKQFDGQKFDNKKPKNIMKSTKHHPLHIMNMDFSQMDPDDKDSKQSTPLSIEQNNNNNKNERETISSQMPMSISSSSSSSLSASSTTTSSATQAATQTVTTTINRIPENVLSSNGPIVRTDVTNEFGENGENIHSVVLNDRVTSISVIEHDDNSRKMFIDHTTSTTTSNNNNNNNIRNNNIKNSNNNAIKPVILINNKLLNSIENASNTGATNRQTYDETEDESNMDKGYYEKTIVNKNGVFIENIRKISNIDQRILDTIGDGDNDGGTIDNRNHDDVSMQIKRKMDDNIDENFLNGNHNNEYDNSAANETSSKNPFDGRKGEINGEINRKSIELMNNVPMAQNYAHYVITSSGKIEKTDTLASDDILAQFQGGLSNTINYNINLNNSNNLNANNAPNSVTSNDDTNITNNKDNDNTNKLNGQQFSAQQQKQHAKLNQASTSTVTSTTNFAGGAAGAAATVKNHLDSLPGGSFLTTLNSAIPASVTTSTLSDQSNTNCIVMGK